MILNKEASEKFIKEIKQGMAMHVVDDFIREKLVDEGVPSMYLDEIVDSPKSGFLNAIGDALSNDSPVRADYGEYLSWEEVLTNPLNYAKPIEDLPKNENAIRVALLDMSDSGLLRDEAFSFARFFYPMFDFSHWGRRNIIILAIGILDNCLALGEDGQVYFDRIDIYESVDRAFRDYGDKYKEYDEPLVVSII